MAHDARSVANQVMYTAALRGERVTPPQLMHIVYFSHALMLAVHGRFLIKQEIEAWRDGPAVPALYRSIKKYGQGPVTERIYVAEEQYDQHEIDMISAAVRLHAAQGGTGLAAAATSSGSPWYRKWHNGKDQSAVIPAREIQTFHKKMVEKWKRKKAREAKVDHARNGTAPGEKIPGPVWPRSAGEENA